jgi:hypothetical protein
MPSDEKIRSSLLPAHEPEPLTAEQILECFSQNIGNEAFAEAESICMHPDTLTILAKRYPPEGGVSKFFYGKRITTSVHVRIGLIVAIPPAPKVSFAVP